MPNFIDYYEQLNLNRGDSVINLNMELSKLESTWKRREITNPEKATKMLVLIMEARKAFQDEQSKAQYDRALDESKQQPVDNDSDEERKKELNRWLDEAFRYNQNKQHNLAREAINIASRFLGADDNDYFYYLLSMISYDNGELQTSFNAINKAIVINPGKAYYYLQSAAIYIDFYYARYENHAYLNEALDYLEKGREALRKCIALSEASGDNNLLIDSLAILADSYANCLNQNLTEAEKLAKRAISLGDKSGDMEELLRDIEGHKEVFQPYQGSNHPSTSSGSDCYIATAVYGSYDCPEVWILRRYRDFSLSQTAFGRLFIKCYYALSPVLVKLFGKTKWFNWFWKSKFDKMVTNLKKRGFSSDRYYN